MTPDEAFGWLKGYMEGLQGSDKHPDWKRFKEVEKMMQGKHVLRWSGWGGSVFPPSGYLLTPPSALSYHPEQSDAS